MSEYKNALLKGASQLNLTLTDEQCEQLLAYHALLIKWGKAYNLSAIRDPREMISRHLVDSLAILPFISGQRIIDVGTGAGLPGVVLAIMFPEKEIVLLDSNGKKTRFLVQVKTELGLNNMQVENCRAESYEPGQGFDIVTSRAFASLYDMLTWTKQLVSADGCFLAMKGLNPVDEIKAMPEGFVVSDTHSLNVPGSDGERHLLKIKKI
jgi:16S rRNA (guanine527-N7)-methyltransferase